MKKVFNSAVAISVLLSAFNQSFVLADEINPKTNKQQQSSDITKDERLSISQQKEIDKDFVESGWQKEKTADGSTVYTDDATIIAKMQRLNKESNLKKIEKEQPSESFRAKKVRFI